MENKIYSKGIFVFFAAMLCCALWGSATPFIKIGYELMLPEKDVASTILFAGIRFFLAGLLTVLIYSMAARKFLYPQKENIGKIAIISVFQTIIQYIFFYIGLANTTGVKGTVISGSNSFFSILIASLVFRQEKLSVRKVIACVLGFAGIVAVNLKGLDLNMNLTGDGFVLFSTIAYAVSSVLMKKYSKDENPVIISGYQFILGGLVMIILGLALGGSVKVESIKAIGVLVYLALLSAVAYSLWGMLLKHNPVSKITIYTFMIPVFGVLLSWIMLSEQSGVSLVNLVIALVLIALGIGVLNYVPKKQ
ncbi:MAG: DMT family transporter [Ruminococcaceae bacterium]|nr:DMT family transporter [Oscillospiraceae bacterium]